jgi:hypothetical protein
MYSVWAGGEPDIQPMLKFRGLVPEETGK